MTTTTKRKKVGGRKKVKAHARRCKGGRPLAYGEAMSSKTVNLPDTVWAALDDLAASGECSRSRIVLETLHAAGIGTGS